MTRLLPCGPTAVVIEVDDTDQAIELATWLRAQSPPDLIDLVPAARTVLVQVARPTALAAIERLVEHFEPTGSLTADGVMVSIDTVYNGDDLDDVAHQSDMSVPQVIEAHSAATYVAVFCGFVPGFTYLTGLADALQLPRRATPRTRVPAGSVAIATTFTGVYPTASPGGWNLLGHTSAVMWDSNRARPALVEPGDRVRFVPVTA